MLVICYNIPGMLKAATQIILLTFIYKSVYLLHISTYHTV